MISDEPDEDADTFDDDATLARAFGDEAPKAGTTLLPTDWPPVPARGNQASGPAS